MVTVIPKNNELELLIKLVECKINIAEFWMSESENKKTKTYYAGEESAYRDILVILRLLLPEVEIS